MRMYPFFYDPTYWVIIPAALLAIYAQFRVSSAYARWKRVASTTGMTGAQMARWILDHNGASNVNIEVVPGKLTDHYDSEDGALRLSEEVYHSRSVAALGIAAHEAGHAIQDAVDYGPMRIRATLVPIANIGSYAGVPLFMLGLVFSWEPLLKIGVLVYSLAVLFYVVTLPVEFNASRRAVAVLGDGLLPQSELEGVKAVLSAAALTYVAAALQALLQLVRLLLIANSRKRRD